MPFRYIIRFNDPEICSAAMVHRAIAVFYTQGQQKRMGDAPLRGRILSFAAGVFLEIDI